MLRSSLIAALAVISAACLGLDAGVLRGDLSSNADLRFAEGATEASGALLSFDPTQHTMDITISIEPLDQPGDMAVVIVTDAGTRYQVLGSFHRCTEEDQVRRCLRRLPALPFEQVGSWSVEAKRGDSRLPASIHVEVEWVPLSS